jgi:hypothetical protein
MGSGGGGGKVIDTEGTGEIKTDVFYAALKLACPNVLHEDWGFNQSPDIGAYLDIGPFPDIRAVPRYRGVPRSRGIP